MEKNATQQRATQANPIAVRATPDEYDAWRAAAEKQGLKRNRWIRNVLNEEAAYVTAVSDDDKRQKAQTEREKIVDDAFPGKRSYNADFK